MSAPTTEQQYRLARAILGDVGNGRGVPRRLGRASVSSMLLLSFASFQRRRIALILRGMVASKKPTVYNIHT